MEAKIAYTCPMHPEVKEGKSGRCPKCGMDLVQENTAKHQHIHENHRDSHSGGMHEGHEKLFKKNFFIALPLTIIVLLLSPQIQEWFNFSITFPGITLLLFSLATFIVFYLAKPFYEMAWGEIRSKKYGMMTLVSLAVLAGYFFSVGATFFFPGESLYWEISTLVLAFLFGHWIEMRSVRATSGAITELIKLTPKIAHKISGNNIIDIHVDKLTIGDMILIRPGEKIPIDGVVEKGESSVNESMITGESSPIIKKEGDEVIGGTINTDGSLTVRITKRGDETVLSQMIRLVHQAQESKPPIQRLADRAASILTFTAITVGISTFIFWSFIAGQELVFAGTLAISVVVIACPHALGLAIPTVTTISASLAAKSGILIRDMKALEAAKNLDFVVFDKTGTLTEGKHGVSKVIAFGKITENEILSLAASVEYHSQHPIGEGIINEAKKRKVNFKETLNFKSYPGRGASGLVSGSRVFVGNKTLLSENGINVEKFKKETEKRKLGNTYVWVAKDKTIVGIIELEDIIREESKKAIHSLHAMGISTAMLTGDSEDVAKNVAKKLSIDTVFAQVLPEDKVRKIRELQEGGNIVAMVGDGVNDAPALTQANVGIAIGAGTGVTIESAEIVLMKNDPRDVVKAIKLSRATGSKMAQNLFWAAGYNVLAIPAAAGVFYNLGILLRPEWAALLMSASSVIVVFNALLLKKTRL